MMAMDDITVTIKLNVFYTTIIYYNTSIYVLDARLYMITIRSWLMFSKSLFPLLIKKKNLPLFLL